MKPPHIIANRSVDGILSVAGMLHNQSHLTYSVVSPKNFIEHTAKYLQEDITSITFVDIPFSDIDIVPFSQLIHSSDITFCFYTDRTDHHHFSKYPLSFDDSQSICANLEESNLVTKHVFSEAANLSKGIPTLIKNTHPKKISSIDDISPEDILLATLHSLEKGNPERMVNALTSNNTSLLVQYAQQSCFYSARDTLLSQPQHFKHMVEAKSNSSYAFQYLLAQHLVGEREKCVGVTFINYDKGTNIYLSSQDHSLHIGTMVKDILSHEDKETTIKGGGGSAWAASVRTQRGGVNDFLKKLNLALQQYYDPKKSSHVRYCTFN